MSPTTKEEKTSQFPIKAKYEYQASPGYRPGPGVRIEKPAGSGGRPSKGQDSVLWGEDNTKAAKPVGGSVDYAGYREVSRQV